MQRHTRTVLALGAGGLALLAVSACGSRIGVGAQSTLGANDGQSLGLSSGLNGDTSAAPSTDQPDSTSSDVPDANLTASASDSPDANGSATSGPTSGPTSIALPTAKSTTPVEVGFAVAKDVGAAMSSLGYSGLSTGDGATEARAATKLINSLGGLGGHPISPVIFAYNPTGDSNTDSASACSTFTEDHHVKAIVAVFFYPVLLECAKKHNVPFVGSGVSSLSDKSLASYPLLTLTSQLTNEDAARNLVAGLLKQSWFTKADSTKPVIGLLTHDDPTFANVPSIVSNSLKAAGLTLKTTEYMPIDGIAQAASAGKAAALKFKAEGVNRVITIDSHGFATSWFALGAGGQGYYPKLGMSTLSEPSIEPGVLTPRQLAGASGIGWVPVLDTIPRFQTVLNIRTTQCINAMSKAGIDMTSASVRLATMTLCDGTFALSDAWRSGETTAAGFLSGLKALGKTYRSPISFSTDFARSRAAISGYRAIGYDAGCDCFTYNGPVVPVS